MLYESPYALKTAELDHWEHGCTGQYQDSTVDFPIRADSLEKVIAAICNTLGCSKDAISVNPCEDDPSRIDAQVYEHDDGYMADECDMAQFKNGEIDLYLCTYSWQFERVTREPANFGE